MARATRSAARRSMSRSSAANRRGATAAFAQVADERRQEDLLADRHPPGGELGREALAAAALVLDLEALALGLGSLEQPGASLVVCRIVLGRVDELGERQADRLLRPPAEHALGGGIPGGDDALGVDRDEGVAGALEDLAGATLALDHRRGPPGRVLDLRPQPPQEKGDQRGGG